MGQQLLPEMEQFILGSLLGDAGLERNKSKSKGINRSKGVGLRFKERHSIKQKEYLLWKKDILSKGISMKKEYFTNGDSITIYSKVLHIFEKFYLLFYPSGKGYKTFNLEVLNKLNPLGLAIWYMDDGSFSKKSHSFFIHCDRRNIYLIKEWFEKGFLKIKGKMYFGKGEGYENSCKIGFNKKDTIKFFEIIEKFIHCSMRYKIEITHKERLKINEYAREYRKRIKNKGGNEHRTTRSHAFIRKE